MLDGVAALRKQISLLMVYVSFALCFLEVERELEDKAYSIKFAISVFAFGDR